MGSAAEVVLRYMPFRAAVQWTEGRSCHPVWQAYPHYAVCSPALHNRILRIYPVPDWQPDVLPPNPCHKQSSPYCPCQACRNTLSSRHNRTTPHKGPKAIHKVKDTLVILRHVGYGRCILGIGNQIDLSILLRRLLYYGREGLIHPRVECPVVLIQYRRACSVNGHSACLAHASNHFHLSDDSLEVITFTRLPMDK